MESPPALSNQERDVKLKIMKNRTAALSLQIQNNPWWNVLIQHENFSPH